MGKIKLTLDTKNYHICAIHFLVLFRISFIMKTIKSSCKISLHFLYTI